MSLRNLEGLRNRCRLVELGAAGQNDVPRSAGDKMLETEGTLDQAKDLASGICRQGETPT